MKSLLARCIAVCVALFLLLQVQLPVLACAVCGCSELCALNNFSAEMDSRAKTKSLLSDSIWGRMILGLAYYHDPELQKLGYRQRVVGVTYRTILSAAGAATLPQNIVSLDTLYDSPDSYAPLIIGLCLEGPTVVSTYCKMIINAGLRHKIKARQAVVRGEVEAILYHLEHSQWGCPEAQKQLTGLIGEKAAEEVVTLWQTSHALASNGEDGTSPKAELPAADQTISKQVVDGHESPAPEASTHPGELAAAHSQ